MPNSLRKELCGMSKKVDERIYESVLLWFNDICERKGLRLVCLLKGYVM